MFRRPTASRTSSLNKKWSGSACTASTRNPSAGDERPNRKRVFRMGCFCACPGLCAATADSGRGRLLQSRDRLVIASAEFDRKYWKNLPGIYKSWKMLILHIEYHRRTQSGFGENMETYLYKCPVCGFLYSVPAYWMSYSPEPTTEFPHLNPQTDAPCGNLALELDESTQSE